MLYFCNNYISHPMEQDLSGNNIDIQHTENWQERTVLMLGKENVEKLNRSHVLIAGLGGVGAMTAEMLGRAGIGKLTLVDNDTISSTNRNRQIIALISNEGKLKTEEMEKRLLDINSDIRVEKLDRYIEYDKMDFLLNGVDYVVDAIDTLTPKVALIQYCMQHRIGIVSSMGAGARLDPMSIKTADISKTKNCTLAQAIRKKLHKVGIYKGLKVVYTDEPVIKESFKPVENQRNKKTMAGTISYLPAIFGCFCASVVIRDLISSFEADPDFE